MMRELDGFYYFCVLCFMINNMYFFLFLNIKVIQSEYVNKISIKFKLYMCYKLCDYCRKNLWIDNVFFVMFYICIFI